MPTDAEYRHLLPAFGRKVRPMEHAHAQQGTRSGRARAPERENLSVALWIVRFSGY
jgi:hypothetical protein